MVIHRMIIVLWNLKIGLISVLINIFPVNFMHIRTLMMAERVIKIMDFGDSRKISVSVLYILSDSMFAFATILKSRKSGCKR